MSVAYIDWLDEILDPRRPGLAMLAVASCPGLGLGLEAAGFSLAVTVEGGKASTETTEANFPMTRVLRAPLSSVSAEEVLEVTRATISLICAVIHPSDLAGLRLRGGDARDKLEALGRLTRELEPSAFLVNVQYRRTSMAVNEAVESVLTELRRRTKYALHHQTVNSADFGVPQMRQSTVVVGLRHSTPFRFPDTTHSQDDQKRLPWVSSESALAKLGCASGHTLRRHRPGTQSRYKSVKPGTRDKVDSSLRLHPRRPSPRLCAFANRGGAIAHIHPLEGRAITPRESARLQSFPDWFGFEGTNTEQYRQVGLSTPPLVARSIGVAVLEAIRYQTETNPTQLAALEVSKHRP